MASNVNVELVPLPMLIELLRLLDSGINRRVGSTELARKLGISERLLSRQWRELGNDPSAA